MRILHINCNYILSLLHQCLIERLNDAGFSNDVFVATYDKTRSIVDIKPYVKVVECFNKWDRINFDYKQNKIIETIQNQYDISSYDCIHAYTLFTDGNTAFKLFQKYEIPYVVAIRNTDFNDFFAKRIFLRKRGIKIMLNAKQVFFLSESYRKQVFERYIPKEFREALYKKTRIIPNGIDDFWIHNTPQNKNQLNNNDVQLIYAGRIDKNKNIPTIQAAMEELERMGVHTKLTIVGRIEDSAEFHRIISCHNTCYFEAVPKEMLIDLYRKADIFVMPSYTESFGLVYAEAMSQGLPVIYSKGQGFDGQFEDGQVGYSVNSRDYRSVAEGVKKVIDNYANISKDVVGLSHKFNWDKISMEYCNVYNSICFHK